MIVLFKGTTGSQITEKTIPRFMGFSSLKKYFWCLGGRLVERDKKGEYRIKMTKIYYIKYETVHKKILSTFSLA